MSAAVKHVEMYDGKVFCSGSSHLPDGSSYHYDGVHQSDWHASPTALVGATCRDCLNAIYTLGCWAANAQRALGPEAIPAGAFVEYAHAGGIGK